LLTYNSFTRFITLRWLRVQLGHPFGFRLKLTKIINNFIQI